MEKAIEWFSRNHVAGNLLMLAVIFAGFTTWFKLKKEIFPETAIDAMAVRIPYPNATPEEVERGVCVPVEEAIADLTGIKKIRSTSSQNMGVVIVEVETGYDVRDVMSDVKSRVDAIDNFPEEAEKPVLEEIVIKAPVMSLTVVADTDEATLRKLADQVRDDLLTYQAPPPQSVGEFLSYAIRGRPKISQVQVAGVRPYEISIEVSEERLRHHGLTLGGVAEAVRRSSIDLPGGSIRTEGGEVILRSLGKRYRAEEFRDIVVATREDGSTVLLEDVAEILDAFEDVDLSSRFDGGDAVVVNVFRVGNEDTLELSGLVKKYIAESPGRLPEGVTLAVWNDQSVYLQGRLDLLVRNALMGLVLVLLTLALFMRPSLAFLVGLSIPLAFAGGIWTMPMLGISINMISLFAFILVLGIVVDDAIITGENVYSHIRAGEHPKVAAIKGTHEVSVVVVFGVLTTVAAFTPMLGLSGVSGKIWPNIPWVVIPALLFSLLQTKFVMPAHLSLLAPHREEKPRNPIFRLQRYVADGLEWFVRHIYQPALGFSLRWHYATVAVFIALFVLTVGVVGGNWIKFKFFPEVEGDILSSKIELAQGVPFAETEKVVERIEAAARKLGEVYRDREGRPVVKHVLASSGSQPFQTGFSPGGPPMATHLGEVTIELTPAAARDVSSTELVDRWRELAGEIPGVVNLTFQAETAAGGNAIDVNLSGGNLERLEEATAWVKGELGRYPGVIDIADSSRSGKDEVRFVELTPAGRAAGLRLDDVARQVRDAFYGNEVQRLQRGRDEVKVMVRYPKDARRTPASFEEMKIRTPAGDELPLKQVVRYEPGRGPAQISRTDRQRSIKVTADVEGEVTGNEVMRDFKPQVLDRIAEKFPGVRYAFEGEQEDQATSVREMGIGFLGALVMMYVLLAIPLRSYWQPFIIMSVIPFGLIGAVWGHAAMGMNLSIMSLCGIVALAGVVVNDSLLMVDYVNRHRRDAGSVMQAAVQAGGRRFRAILLTSLTTFAGLAPMLLEKDVQGRFLVPMAVSLAFGIMFATVITLFLVPSIYLILDDVTRWLARGRKRKA